MFFYSTVEYINKYKNSNFFKEKQSISRDRFYQYQMKYKIYKNALSFYFLCYLCKKF